MAVVDRGFDGSTVSIGSSNVGPLTAFHHSDQPATARTSGANALAHTYTVGRHNQSVTVGFLGSKCPDAGTIMAILAALNDGTSFSGTGAITQVRISGRKDGAIEGSLTSRPTPITPGATSFSSGDVSFNGTMFDFNGAATGIVSLSYDATCAEVDDSGANDSDVLISPGIPDRTVTLEVMGGSTMTIGAISIAWNDGGSLGSGNSYQLMSVQDGGGIDDAITTTYTWKPHVV